MTALRAALLYHHVTREPGHPRGVSAARFEAQLKALADSGRRFARVSEWARPAAEPRVFVTFDDGYEDTHRVAFPVLRRLGIPASVFLITDHIGGTNRWDRPGVPTRQHLSEPQIEALCAAGWEMHSHTACHADVRALSDSELEDDVARSTAAVRRWTGGALYAAYPWGRSEPRLVRLLQAADYAGAFLAEPGWPDSDPFRLPRHEVTESWAGPGAAAWSGAA